MTEIHKVALELTQIKSFRPDTPKKLYGKHEVIGTETAVKEEMAETWEKMSQDGDTFKENMKKLKETCYNSVFSGEGHRVMTEGFSQFF